MGEHPIQSVQLIRAEIDYFGFATALMGILSGGSPIQRIRTAFQVTPVIDEDLKQGSISGIVFQCTEFLTFVNGSYDATDLKEMHSPDGFTKPTTFTIETWEPKNDDPYVMGISYKTTFEGVNWISARHFDWGGQGDRCCAGEAAFSYEQKTVEICDQSEEVHIPRDSEYPRFELVRILKRS